MSLTSEELAQVFSSFDPQRKEASLRARQIKKLVSWIREASFYSKQEMPLSPIRMQIFLRELDRNEALKSRFNVLLCDILKSFDIATLITQTGLSQPQGFFREIGQRFVDKILPRHSNNPSFRELVFFVFPHHSDPLFLRHLPIEVQNKVLTLFDVDGKSAESGREFLKNIFAEKLLDALEILGSQAYVLSENPEMRDRRWVVMNAEKYANPFKALNVFLYKLVENSRTTKKLSDDEVFKYEDDFSEILAGCRDELSRVLTHLEENSVSVDLVYQIEVLHLLLDRIRSLLIIQSFSRGSAGPKGFEFFAYLIEEEQRRRSIRTLIAQNMHYLARKIVERAADTGEHYIAKNEEEKHTLFKAALGGGFLTAFTAFFKTLIHNVNLAPFFEGFFSALNYSGSFIFMQLSHLTLATKQPAMTAAALASKMSTNDTSQSELKKEMKDLLKSQALAAAGNISAVIPTAYLFSVLWQWIMGSPIIDPKEAHHIIESHDPLTSLTLFYALLTGIILWSASIVHGWVDNWMIYRDIPNSISESFVFENVLNYEKRKKVSRWLQKNLSGILANIALGSILAYTSIIGKFFALPLEVRHVTLATGALTLSWASIPVEELKFSLIATGFVSISLILLCNILTSFFLSLWLATRARGYAWLDVMRALKATLFKEA